MTQIARMAISGRGPRGFACVVGVFALGCLGAVAQSGGIDVRVSDAVNGEPVAGATVVLTNDQGLVAGTAGTTDRQGQALFPVLRVGPGYTVEVSMPGYATQRLTGLRVRTGESLPLVLNLSGEIREKVSVRARTAVVDLEKSGTSSRFSDEFIGDLPVPGRFYQEVLPLAPGVNDEDGDGNPNVHGARSRDFKATVNGVSNVDPLTGQWLSYVNPDSIEEMEIITTGAGVEFGRAQGGFARILQKQGSNQLEGLFNFIYRSSLFDGDGAGSVPGTPSPDFDWVQPGFQLSGPFIRDRLWFRFSHEYISREDPVNLINRVDIVRREQSINADQITWQVSPRNKLAFQYQYDPLTIENQDISTQVGVDSSSTLNTGGPTYSIKWTAPYSPRLLVESLVSYQNHKVERVPTNPVAQQDCLIFRRYPSLLNARCNNLSWGVVTGPFIEESRDRRQRFAVNISGTSYHARFLGASHRLKFGFVVENERYFRQLKRGTVIDDFQLAYPIFPPPPVVGTAIGRISVPRESDDRATATNWALYAEDQIKPTAGLSMTVGLRLDITEINARGLQAFDPAAEAAEFFARFNAVAPAFPQILAQRLAKEIFTAYENVATLRTELAHTLQVNEAFIGLAAGVTQMASWDNRRQREGIQLRNQLWSPRLSLAWDPWANGKTKFAFSVGRYYDKIFLAVPLVELEPATIPFEAAATPIINTFEPLYFDDNLSDLSPAVTTRLVDRDLSTPYQDEFTFSFERALWPETSIRASYIRRDFKDQLQDADVNHINSVTLNPGWGEMLVISNSNTAKYEAFQLEFIRRQFRSWEMNTSYVYSEAFGDAEDFDQQLGNIPSLAADERGYLSYDQRHIFRFNATTVTPTGWRFGGTVRWESGLPYSIVRSRVFSYIDPPEYFTLGTSGRQIGFVYPTGERNDQRNPSFWTFGGKVQKEFVLRRNVLLGVSLEVFNLLNDDRLKRSDEVDGVFTGQRRFGRQYQLGLRLSF